MRPHKRLLLSISLVLTGMLGYGQDTLSVYFQFGSPKVDPGQFETLNSIPERFTLADVRGVRFIGMADSVGSLEDNLKLSQKRARNVARYCKRILPKEIPTRLAALGERSRKDPAKSRRVDIVFFLKDNVLPDSSASTKDTLKETVPCFYIDYKLLHRNHTRTVIKREKEYTHIEVGAKDRQKGRQYYWASENDSGALVTHKVKWKSQPTGNHWWSERRFTTSIPQPAFEKYKVFTLENPPCTTCAEDLEANRAITLEDTCLQVDRFLQDNLQIRPLLFKRKYVKARVPREYVDLEDQYFIGCDMDQKLKWYTQRGPLRKHYYFAKLPRYTTRVGNITRVMKCCAGNPEPSECNSPLSCIPVNCAGADEAVYLTIEIGNNLHQNTHAPYIMAGVTKAEGDHFGSLMFGTDIETGLYSSLRYRYHIFQFPFGSMLPVARWHRPEMNTKVFAYGQAYIGTELRMRTGGEETDFLEQNIHLGVAYTNAKRTALIPRIFVQQGIGIDFFKHNADGLYFPLQMGMDVNLIRLVKW